MTIYESVQRMHRQFGAPTPKFPRALEPHRIRERIRMCNEELCELAQAETLYDQADAVVDLVVFALGTADLMGIDFDGCFGEVMRANMAKESRPTDRGQFDLVKPEGWTPPDLAPFLQ